MATIGALESACPCCSRRERVPGAQWPVARSNWGKIGMDQFVWDVPAWVVCPGEGVG